MTTQNTLAIIAEALTGSGTGNSGTKLAQAIQQQGGGIVSINFAAKYIHNLLLQNSQDSRTLELLKSNEMFASFNEEYGLIEKLSAYSFWATLVAPNAIWDIKSTAIFKNTVNNQSYTIDPSTNIKYSNDIWGNIHYGFVGKAAGFSSSELVSGAGIAQIATILSLAVKGSFDALEDAINRFDQAKLKDILSAIDDPKDKSAVELGISLWTNYSTNLNLNTFIQAVKAHSTSLNTF